MTRDEHPQGTVHFMTHESELLRDNPVGDPHVREVVVYTPAGYDASVQRYPVIYCLTGFTGRGRMFLNDNAFQPTLAERLDRLIATGKIRPIIAVMPDCFTYYGGAQYINSTATGNYEDYLTQEIVPFVDERFRTLKGRDHRAVIGKSSGGYGALIMGMRHADVFGLVCSTAGDCYFEYCYMEHVSAARRAIDSDPQAFMRRVWEKGGVGRDDFAALNFIGMSACYSPKGTSFDLPFDLETGEIRSDVWQRWLEHDPVRLLERYADNLRTLKLLFIDAGTSDEFGLDVGARILAQRLQKNGISHIHEEFDGGHSNISWRQDRSLEMISQHL
jgi:enterochelin esterase-like enzyme